jgi:pimeloyl-ACP methyl ester carboxylesterase
MSLALEQSGAGAPVVFLHGLTFDRQTWRPILDRIGGRVDAIAIDLPRHGESGDGPTDLEPLADAVHAELTGLGIERPVVVGHSISGGVAGTYAARHPAAGVVIVDGSPWVEPFGELLQRLAPELRGDRFAEVFDRVFQTSMAIDLLPEQPRALVHAHQQIDQGVVLAYWRELMETPPAQLQARSDAAIESVDVPVLGVFGRELAPPERARLRSASLEVWPGLGHFPHLAEPERFTARLLAFVGEVAREPTAQAAR